MCGCVGVLYIVYCYVFFSYRYHGKVEPIAMDLLELIVVSFV